MTTLSPEQLTELANSGKSISEIQSLSDGLVSESNGKPQTDGLGCSIPLVKDESYSSDSPVVNNLRTTAEVAIPTRNPLQGLSHSNPAVPSQPSRDTIVSTNFTNAEFDGLDIKNPLELLILLDENIMSGETKLHKWQKQFMIDFAKSSHNKEHPFRAAVQACNGSGKDKYVIAACAVWLCMRYREVNCPITSSSGDQLDNQTGRHIDRLCAKSNVIFGKLWKINYRYYEFQHIGELGNPMPSILKLFATDEPGKAEGYHPVDVGKRMAIFTSETKSIPEDITNALTRCTGYTHRIDASSPGSSAGYFYNICSSAIPRNEIEDIEELDSTQVILYKVTAYDCPHITNNEIEAFASSLPGGKSSQIFQSGIMAEFGSTDEMTVIPSTFVWRTVENLPKRTKKFDIPWIVEDYNNAGLDLSDGGAETVLTIRNGNKLLGMDAFKFDDTEDSIKYIDERLKFWKVDKRNSKVNGDYCGLGGPMLRSLKAKGWNVKFIDSRNKASESKTYANRGTELFFNMRKLFERQAIIIFYDKLLIDQLCTRYYKIRDGKIHQLLSKLEQKAKGFPSPDRADSLNLCFWGYQMPDLGEEDEEEEEEVQEESKQNIIPDFDMRVWANDHRPKYNLENAVFDSDTNDLREELASFNRNRLTLNRR